MRIHLVSRMASSNLVVVELRARQRTFDGAYARTALVNFGYALTILRLFDKRFARSTSWLLLHLLRPIHTPSKVGLVYTILGVALTVMSFFRHRHSRHDFADIHRKEPWEHARPTVGQTGKRVFGRPFVTAGWMVIAVTVIVAAVEISLLVLILNVRMAGF